HDVQLAIVVYESTVGRDLGVDAHPEPDIGLDLGGPYERILRTRAYARYQYRDERAQCTSSGTSDRHGPRGRVVVVGWRRILLGAKGTQGAHLSVIAATVC